MRPVPLTNLTQGINHLRVKGSANPGALYDLVNAYINQEGVPRPRPGTSRVGDLLAGTITQLGSLNAIITLGSLVEGANYATGFYGDTALTGGSGTGATADITVNSAGDVATVTIDAGGQNYVVGDALSASGLGNGSGFLIYVDSVSSGSGYTLGSYTNVALTGGTGTGATADITIDSAGNVSAITLVNGGSGYVIGDVLSVNAGDIGSGGSGFTITVANVTITTTGLVYFDGALHTFVAANDYGSLSAPFALDVLAHPTIQNEPISKIWYAQPFMGFLYVVPEFANGDIFHYWLQSSGEWNTNTVYTPTSIVTPTTPNGFAYQAQRALQPNPTWSPNLIVATSTVEAQFTASISGTTLTTSAFTHGSDLSLAVGQVIQGPGITTCTLLSGASNVWTVSVSQTVSGVVGATASLITTLVPMIEPTVANGFYYVPSQIISPASPVAGQSLNIATGSTEPAWVASAGSLIDDAGDYLAYTNSQIITLGGTVATNLGTNITGRYGNSDSIAGLTQVSTTTNAASTLPLTIGALSPWSAGKVYQLGSVVTPTNKQGAYVLAIPDGDFTSGSPNSFWTASGAGATAWNFKTSGNSYNNNGEAYNPPGAANNTITSNKSGVGTVSPGQTVTANCFFTNGTNSSADFTLTFAINWYDSSGNLLSSKSIQQGSTGGKEGHWQPLAVTGTAPSGTSQAAVSFTASSGTADRDSAAVCQVSWSLQVAAAATLLVYQCVSVNGSSSPSAGQVLQGTSGHTEPVWPTTVSTEVTDGQLAWEAIGSSVIVWEAFPIMLSSASPSSEPLFPTVVGNTVWDGAASPAEGGFSWLCISRQVTDSNCPNTQFVAAGASHIFAGDIDIVPFSAAVNPTDWTSSNNAGYLPTGLQNYGGNPVAVLGLYRSNLMVFNSGGYQMWQIDPDPTNMALLDAQPIGTTFTRGAQTIGQDMIITTPQGIRNVGMTGATVNMQVGSFGQPIDDLVKAQIAAGVYEPIALYYPARGQYWLMFGPQAFVGTQNQPNQIQWSRYLFPDAITDWTLWGDDLYLRSAGSLVWKVDPTLFADDVQTGNLEVSTVSPTDGIAEATTAASISTVIAGSTTVTFSSYQGNSIPTPLNNSSTFYIRSKVQQVLGIAAGSFAGETISTYETGVATMNWSVPTTMNVTASAANPGSLSYAGNAGLANGTAVTVSAIAGQPLPLATGTYYVINYGFAGGVSTIGMGVSTGAPEETIVAGQCNLAWTVTTATTINSATLGGGDSYVTCTTLGTDIPNGTTVQFTGSPLPGGLSAATNYTLQQVSATGDYHIFSGASQVTLTSTGSSVNMTIQNVPLATNESATTNISGTYYIPTGSSSSDALFAGMQITLSANTGQPPLPAGTYTIGTAVASGGLWYITLSGHPLAALAYNSLATLTVNSVVYEANTGTIIFSVTGDLAQSAFTTLHYNGKSYAYSSATYTYDGTTSSWSWGTGGVVGPLSGTFIAYTVDSSSRVTWQAQVSVGHYENDRQGVSYYGFRIGNSIGSLSALIYTWSPTKTYAVTGHFGNVYGWLNLASSAPAVGSAVTFTQNGSDPLPSPLLTNTTYYVVTSGTAAQVSTSLGGTPVVMASSSDGAMDFTVPHSIQVTANPTTTGYLIASSTGAALPVGTLPFTVTEYMGQPLPTGLALATTYYVLSVDGTNTNMFLTTSAGVPGDAVTISSGGNCVLNYNQPYTATVNTTAGNTGYIVVGNVTSQPISLGEIITFEAISAMPTPFAINTNYQVSEIYNANTNIPPFAGWSGPWTPINDAYVFNVTSAGNPVTVAAAGTMEMVTPGGGGSTNFNSIVWWPWLDCGTPGIDKMFDGFHISGTGDAQVSFGWNENDLTAFTPLYDLGLADTVPGFPIGLSVMAKTISPYVFFAGPQNWTLESFVMYVTDLELS